MTETTWAVLRALLADRYDEIKGRLTRRLGSEELASESLHETWLRLHRQDDVGQIKSPANYLLRIATNIARDSLRGQHRRASRSDVNAVLEIADPSPGPEKVFQVRADLRETERAINELPPRTRTILMATRLEGLSHEEIAAKLGVSRRTVFYELKRGLEQLDAVLEKREAAKIALPDRSKRLKDSQR